MAWLEKWTLKQYVINDIFNKHHDGVSPFGQPSLDLRIYLSFAGPDFKKNM